jgi:hypothetical protein
MIAMAVMIIGISSGSEVDVVSYLSTHMIYKLLISIIAASIADHDKIITYSDMHKLKNPTIIWPLLFAFLIMISVPSSLTFFAKTNIANQFKYDISYFIIILASIFISLAVPIRHFVQSSKTTIIHLNYYNKASIYFSSLVLVIISYLGSNLGFLHIVIDPYFSFEHLSKTHLFSADSMKQLTIIIVSLIAGYFMNLQRILGKAFNLVEFIGGIILLMYKYLQDREEKKEEKEPWSFGSLHMQLSRNVTLIHNQQSAIFIVFTIFLLLLSILLFTN